MTFTVFFRSIPLLIGILTLGSFNAASAATIEDLEQELKEQRQLASKMQIELQTSIRQLQNANATLQKQVDILSEETQQLHLVIKQMASHLALTAQNDQSTDSGRCFRNSTEQ